MEINYPQIDAYLSQSLSQPVIAFEAHQYKDDEGLEWITINACDKMIPREMGLVVMRSASIAEVDITLEQFTELLK